MTAGALGLNLVAKKRKPAEPRDRIDIRASPQWIARVRRQADRYGISVSAYIKQAVSRQLEKDEPTERENP